MQLECAIAVGGLYGRFDHVLGVLSTLHKIQTHHRIIVLDRSNGDKLYNVIFLLSPVGQFESDVSKELLCRANMLYIRR